MTHPDVTLDVKRWGAGEPEGLHVSVDLGFVDSRVGPGASESGYQLVINRASVSVNTSEC